MTFEELGVDQLFVDERIYTRICVCDKDEPDRRTTELRQQPRIRHVSEDSLLQESSDGRGVVFATGTPYPIRWPRCTRCSAYLGPEMLSERKVDHFDAWAANFAEL